MKKKYWIIVLIVAVICMIIALVIAGMPKSKEAEKNQNQENIVEEDEKQNFDSEEPDATEIIPETAESEKDSTTMEDIKPETTTSEFAATNGENADLKPSQSQPEEEKSEETGTEIEEPIELPFVPYEEK